VRSTTRCTPVTRTGSTSARSGMAHWDSSADPPTHPLEHKYVCPALRAVRNAIDADHRGSSAAGPVQVRVGSPITSTLVYGERDAVVADPLMTRDQAAPCLALPYVTVGIRATPADRRCSRR
jgi:hypothetical protein